MIWASWYKLPLIGDETFKDYIFINKETCCAIAIIFTDQLFHWFRKQLYVILSVPSDLRHFFLQILLTSLYRKGNLLFIVKQTLVVSFLIFTSVLWTLLIENVKGQGYISNINKTTEETKHKVANQAVQLNTKDPWSIKVLKTHW